jgi:hypothetical protein
MTIGGADEAQHNHGEHRNHGNQPRREALVDRRVGRDEK